MFPARWAAESSIVAISGLPAASLASLRFDAMVDGIADHVRDRIGEFLDDGLVHLGLVAGGDKPHLLAEFRSDIADEARHSRKHGSDGLHADGHHAFLQLPRMRGEFLAAPDPLLALSAPLIRELLGKHGLRDHEFSHHVHKPVHARKIDPDRRGALRGMCAAGKLDGCRRRICGLRLHSFGRGLMSDGRLLVSTLALDLQDAVLIDKLENFGNRRIGCVGA